MLLEPIYLVGPTAVGKTDIAVELAKQCNGEIIGADAFQIYRGLDILTAKPDRAALSQANHHLIGVIDPKMTFDVAQFRALALKLMAEVVARGRKPIITGGTGLYVRALTHGLSDLPGADPDLRSELAAEPLGTLVRRLEELDPTAAQRIDRQNPRRVIRAIEVCLLSGKPFSSFHEEWNSTPTARGVFLSRPRAELYDRINRRTELMFESGVVDEVRAMGEIGTTAAQTIGFREIRSLIEGKTGQAECVAQIQQQTRNYAKRQMTWFRREVHFHAMEVAPECVARELALRVLQTIEANSDT